jgi:hypothetical protein
MCGQEGKVWEGRCLKEEVRRRVIDEDMEVELKGNM